VQKIFIHMGLHKTASTFLQKKFFISYSNKSGYIQIRKDARNFLDYTLNCNDIDFSANHARKIFEKEINAETINQTTLTMSDEQFCGSPWNDAKDRARYFDRLNAVFPNAFYIVVFRNQEDIVKSLYLQYVKTGGSANWQQFFCYKRHPLEFSRKSYLNYGNYLNYIFTKIDSSRIKCLLYEDMLSNPNQFFSDLAAYIGFETDERLNEILSYKANKSLPSYLVKIIIFINKFCSSMRQPFLMLPSKLRTYLIRILIRILPQSKKGIIDPSELKAFCYEPKKNNGILAKHVDRDLTKLGYW
jgi:hypothetical protein